MDLVYALVVIIVVIILVVVLLKVLALLFIAPAYYENIHQDLLVVSQQLQVLRPA